MPNRTFTYRADADIEIEKRLLGEPRDDTRKITFIVRACQVVLIIVVILSILIAFYGG